MHDTDRRRLILAAVLTLIAVPAFLLFTRSDGSTPAADDTIAVSDDPMLINPQPGDEPSAPATAAPTSNESQRPDLEPPDGDPIFMDGPIAATNDDIVEVAVPAQPAIEPLFLDASYLSTVPGRRSCMIRDLPSGRTITVTNLDNGRSITCVTLIAPSTQREDLVMHTDNFEQLADLTEAPIPVEVRQ